MQLYPRENIISIDNLVYLIRICALSRECPMITKKTNKTKGFLRVCNISTKAL